MINLLEAPNLCLLQYDYTKITHCFMVGLIEVKWFTSILEKIKNGKWYKHEKIKNGNVLQFGIQTNRKMVPGTLTIWIYSLTWCHKLFCEFNFCFL